MSTPIERVARLLDEGGRFMVELPGQASIDLTPDLIAALDELRACGGQRPRLNSRGHNADSPSDAPAPATHR